MKVLHGDIYSYEYLHYNIYKNKMVAFAVAQALHDFKTSTILVYMTLNGKGSN